MIKERQFPRGQLVRCAISDHIYHIKDCRKNWKGQWVGKKHWDPKPLHLTTPNTTERRLYHTNGALSYKT